MLTRLFFKRQGAEPAERGQFTRLARLIRTRPADIDPLRSTEDPGEGFEGAWRASMRRRVMVVVTLIAAWLVGIEARLVQLQVVDHAWYSEQALDRQQRLVKSEAVRGDIVDRHGDMLAYTVDADSIVGYPVRVEKPALTASALCGALGDCTPQEQQDFTSRLTGNGQFVVLRRSRAVSPDQAQRVADLKLAGVALKSDTRRYYPRYELAAHVLGFVGLDNKGLAGLEYAYDTAMHGKDGKALIKVDAHRTRLETRVEQEPVGGTTLELTLDMPMQYIVERELKRGVDEHRAKGGAVVVMNPATGEILAMASYPTFNPNAATKSQPEDRRNRAVQDVYEPGSTFKIVTASAAIEEGIKSPTDLIDCDPGFIVIPGRKPIYDTSRHGVMTMEDVIVKSSNVGAIKIGQEVGIERLSRYVSRFGFGQKLSPDFTATETAGLWSPSRLDASGLASVSMGYQVGVTPLQMATAASAVANGGVLVEPHLVRAFTRDGHREDVAPKALRRVMSAATAATMTTIMEAVTERGTAMTARLVGYQVAGKTGTAGKLVDGVYSKSAYNSSFVGFVPSRRPELTILVVIDTPTTGGYYGGVVAGPVFKRIAEAALQLRGVPPTINPSPTIMVDAAPALLPTRPERPTAIVPTAAMAEGAVMPDVRGLGARDANRVLTAAGLNVRIQGSGLVMSQSPLPGEPIEPGGWSALDLGRPKPVAVRTGARR